MVSKRFKKLPEKTSELSPEVLVKILPSIKKVNFGTLNDVFQLPFIK